MVTPIITHSYSKDLSRKIKAGIKTLRDNGKSLSGVAPFGFKISENDHYQLAIDEKTAPVVRRIFDMALAGNNSVQIAKALNCDGILTPMGFKKQENPNRKWNTHTDCNIWSGKIVIKVMREMRYTGALVQGKLETPVVGSGKQKMVAKTDWHITPNCHEAIVSQAEFDEVQRLTIRVRNSSKLTDYANLSPLAGKVRCGGCGYALSKNHNKTPAYYCRQKKFTESSTCLDKGVLIATVEDAILVAMQKLFELIPLAEERQKSLDDKKLSASMDLMRQIQAMQREISKINNSKLAHYKKYCDGNISKDEYLAQRNIYDERLSVIAASVSLLEKNRPEVSINEDNALLGLLQNLKYDGKLSREVVNALIDRIFIYDGEHIEVKWKFADVFATELLPTKENIYETSK